MATGSFLGRLYSLDTLDTRFTTSSTTPLKEAAKPDRAVNGRDGLRETASSKRAVDIDAATVAASRTTVPAPGSRPSKWNTWEYYFHILVVGTMVPLMIKMPYDVSKETDPQYPKFQHLLSNGWIPGRKVYAGFRNNFPTTAVVVLLHPLLRKVYNMLRPTRVADSARPDVRADAKLEQRISYDVIFAMVFLIVLHGSSAAKIAFILYLNYCIGTKLPRKLIPAATWIFNIGILFANEFGHGYRYRDIATLFGPSVWSGPNSTASSSSSLYNWGAWLDSYGGIIPRWEVFFKMTVLRLISYNLDYYWSLDRRAGSPIEKKQLNPSDLSERDRVATPAPTRTFSFYYYFAYSLYSPLYLAGPILSFNDYIHQLRYPSPSITTSRTVMYGIRFLLSLLCMELILHYIYAVAICKSNPDWSAYTPFQVSMLGFFNLHIIWLKLLLPWRMFRFWSLLDGVDPPENMVRCMSDNYSTLAFWRGWHRSFNRWIVRYIYVPLGGSGRSTSVPRSLVNLLAVFTFVALWHDISLTLLTWSWLVVLFIVPELFCSLVLFPARAYKDKPETYRVLCAIGAVGNILMMMAANLVGFAIGLDGLRGLVTRIISDWYGWTFLTAASCVLFVGVMVMFEIRESEKRKGIIMKC